MTRQTGTSHALMRVRARLRREGGTRICAWCGGPVDMRLPREHPGSFELDHVQPRRYGGGDDPVNIRILHKRCNRQRGAGRRQLNTMDDRSASW